MTNATVPMSRIRSIARNLRGRGFRATSEWSATTRAVLTACGALLVVFVLTSSMNGLAPTSPALAAGGFLFIVLIVGNQAWAVHAMLIVLFMTSVPEIPRGVRVGGVYLYFYEFLIFGAAIYALALIKRHPSVWSRLQRLLAFRIVGLFGIFVLVGIAAAVGRNYPFWDIQYDVKSIVELLIVIFVTVVIIAVDDWQRYIKTITWILVLSAVLTVYASATGFVLWGRTETAELVASGGRAIAGGSDAVRIITQTAPLALAVLLGGTAYLLFGRTSSVRVLTMLIPAFLITILSFSRNTLLALAGTMVFAVLIAWANGLLVRLVLRLAMVPVLAAVAVVAVLSVGGALGARDWIETQVTGYSNRVFAGLDQANERDDTSANYRDEESQYIDRAAAEHPVFGGGFGTHYKPPAGKRGTFTAFEGTMYSHNAYNWLYLKVGLAGLAAFIAIIIACLVPALSRRTNSDLMSTAASALAGLGIAIFVTPMPIEQSGSALLGIVMGVCIAAPLLTAPSGRCGRCAENHAHRDAHNSIVVPVR